MPSNIKTLWNRKSQPDMLGEVSAQANFALELLCLILFKFFRTSESLANNLLASKMLD